ncbi:MAG: GNAT family N-acetyltransferase [Methylobacterium sp.]|jgi:GNAT superfamily N-acetyltransferase|nr:GNAT family N-acetyltransferase [Roseomonas sp.]MCA3282977.1 GNAT family N-acetyltransferase [Roseomonas sp.]MCA3297790.1 GNAT family N-acetyltransferase [Roseomonas sp.]MCA3653576.1 GNAT family N-acetyltransferase [Methylobacterium sp.]
MMRSDQAQPVVGPLAPGPLQDRVLDLAATGRSGLSALLGDAAARHALFRRGMRADRFLVATVEGELAGYLSLKYAGHGPFAPSLGDFLRCYGPAQGAHAFAVYRVIEARSRPRPGGAYLYGIDVLKPWRGHRRGRDVGGALIQAAIAATARLGLRTLDLEVRRPAARALFLRMGAVQVTAPRLSFTGLLIASAGDYQRLTIGIPRA